MDSEQFVLHLAVEDGGSEKILQALAADFEKLQTESKNAVRDMQQFKKVASYLATVDKALGRLKTKNPNLYKQIFAGMDDKLVGQLQGMIGMTDTAGNAFVELSNKIDTAFNQKTSIKQLNGMVNEINSLFTSIGAKPPLEPFKGMVNVDMLNQARAALDDFALRYSDMGKRLDKGVGGGGAGMQLSEGVQKEIDKLTSQQKKLEQLKKDLKGSAKSIQNTKAEIPKKYQGDLSSDYVKGLISDFEGVQKALAGGDKSSTEYYQNLKKQYDLIMKMRSVSQRMRGKDIDDKTRQDINNIKYDDGENAPTKLSTYSRRYLQEVGKSEGGIDALIEQNKRDIANLQIGSPNNMDVLKSVGNGPEKMADGIKDSAEKAKGIINEAKQIITQALKDYENATDQAVSSGKLDDDDIEEGFKTPEMEAIRNKALGALGQFKNEDELKKQLSKSFDRVANLDIEESYKDHVENMFKNSNVELKPEKITAKPVDTGVQKAGEDAKEAAVDIEKATAAYKEFIALTERITSTDDLNSLDVSNFTAQLAKASSELEQMRATGSLTANDMEKINAAGGKAMDHLKGNAIINDERIAISQSSIIKEKQAAEEAKQAYTEMAAAKEKAETESSKAKQKADLLEQEAKAAKDTAKAKKEAGSVKADTDTAKNIEAATKAYKEFIAAAEKASKITIPKNVTTDATKLAGQFGNLQGLHQAGFVSDKDYKKAEVLAAKTSTRLDKIQAQYDKTRVAPTTNADYAKISKQDAAIAEEQAERRKNADAANDEAAAKQKSANVKTDANGADEIEKETKARKENIAAIEKESKTASVNKLQPTKGPHGNFTDERIDTSDWRTIDGKASVTKAAIRRKLDAYKASPSAAGLDELSTYVLGHGKNNTTDLSSAQTVFSKKGEADIWAKITQNIKEAEAAQEAYYAKQIGTIKEQNAAKDTKRLEIDKLVSEHKQLVSEIKSLESMDQKQIDEYTKRLADSEAKIEGLTGYDNYDLVGMYTASDEAGIKLMQQEDMLAKAKKKTVSDDKSQKAKTSTAVSTKSIDDQTAAYKKQEAAAKEATVAGQKLNAETKKSNTSTGSANTAQNAAKTESAIKEVTNAQQKLNSELKEGQTINVSGEVGQLSKLESQINNVKNAVISKSKAFVDEGGTVSQVVGKEISALSRLQSSIKESSAASKSLASTTSASRLQQISDLKTTKGQKAQVKSAKGGYALEGTLVATNGILNSIAGKLSGTKAEGRLGQAAKNKPTTQKQTETQAKTSENKKATATPKATINDNAMFRRFGAQVALTQQRVSDGGFHLGSSDEFRKQVDQQEELYNRLLALKQKINSTSTPDPKDILNYDTTKANFTAVQKDIDNAIKSYDKLRANADIVSGTSDGFVNSITGRKKELTDFIQANHGATASVKEFTDGNHKCVAEIKNSDGSFSKLSAEVGKYGTTVASTVKSTYTKTGMLGRLAEEVKTKFRTVGSYMIASTSFYDVIRVVRAGLTYIKDIDSALVELKKVTNETDASYANFLQTSSKTANTIGSTVSELTTMTADWARLGYSMDEAAQLAKSTGVLLNVSEFENADQASQALISSMQAFQYTAEDSMHVVDILNEVGNNYAVSSDGLATALQDSASALMAAGNDMEQSVAMISAANKVKVLPLDNYIG